MATITRNQIQNVKLRKTRPPKPPLGTTSSQNGGFPSDNGGLSVAAVLNKFDPKLSSPRKPGALAGSLTSQDGSKPSMESVMSVSSARAKFEQIQMPRKQLTNRNQARDLTPSCQTKEGLHKLDKNRNQETGKQLGEPKRKQLLPPFRIGPAPRKKPKPANLKLLLRKYRDQIVLSNVANRDVPTSTQEEEEEIYDDVQSALHGNQGCQDEEFYETM